MRVLFTTTNWKGAYFCMIPLGWALTAAGHEVRVLCAPSQAPAISAAGLVPVPALKDIDMMVFERMARHAAVRSGAEPAGDGLPLLHPLTGRPLAHPDEYDAEEHGRAFLRACEQIHRHNQDAAVALARSRPPALVVHDLMSLEGPLAARVAGVPAVYHSPGMFGALETGLEDTHGAFARHGLGEWKPTQVSHFIDPTPPALQPDAGPACRMPVRYLPYNGPGQPPRWTWSRPPRPRVCLLWSNSALEIYGPAVPALRHTVDAVTARGAELVLTASAEQVDALGELPDGVRVLRHFPVNLLLGTCDALIHQGSVNPMMTAATAGVPQLMLPFTDDQTEMSRRFGRAGSSLALPGPTARRDEVEEAVTRLLDEGALREAAHRIRAGAERRPPVSALVGPLERLARGHDVRPASRSEQKR
ncbi:nucleotide disphospho-sugar-binding domain-containing protein [Streptomyces sp. NPDC006193]|uniref:nucleotide disphospho-sugar-binding domain-containing protein n=1 Tax=Streptomyces sp. NPDC006193 TaxID=3155717 RepID=UPI0033AD2F9A